MPHTLARHTERRQATAGGEIPEQHWMYRWAKKFWFNDFGAYAKADHDGTAKVKMKALAVDSPVQR